MVDERRTGMMRGGRNRLVLLDYEKHHTPLRVISQHDSPETALAKLDDRTHNSLKDIQGDSPYYHVATNIYQALRELDGHTPSFDNPFITKNWLSNVGIKAAYGTVKCSSAGGSVDLELGVTTNGTYNGGTGFTNARIIVSPKSFVILGTGVSTQYYYNWITPGKKFEVVRSGSGGHILGEDFFWFAAGD